MKRKQLLSELENEYANIYEFSGNFGDEPLNILDQFIDQAGLRTEAEYLLNDMINMIDSEFLSDNTLARLLQVYKQVVQECKVELQD
jgi:hypothetical protein